MPATVSIRQESPRFLERESLGIEGVERENVLSYEVTVFIEGNEIRKINGLRRESHTIQPRTRNGVRSAIDCVTRVQKDGAP